MTPLESVAQALQRIAAQEAHTLACNRRGVQMEMQGEQADCSCDRDAQVAARQAEAVLAMLEASQECMAERVYMFGPRLDDLYREAGAAALRVLAQRAEREKL